MSVAEYHPFTGGKSFQTNRASGVEFVGADANFGTETILEAIGKTCGQNQVALVTRWRVARGLHALGQRFHPIPRSDASANLLAGVSDEFSKYIQTKA